MMKKPLLYLHFVLFLLIAFQSFSQVDAGRMNEVFIKTDIIPASQFLNDPWEITYGPDDYLWVTEAKGYKVDRINPNDGTKTTVLNLTTITPSSWRKAYTPGGSIPDPQGGLMGLAIHPEFMTDPAKKFVYVAYIHDYVGTDVTLSSGEFVSGPLFTTWVVRFTYDGTKLTSPIKICDTIRGSNDHNSGRMIIAPVGGVDYLFYAVGDQGGGQFGNIAKVNKAQQAKSYEGKILRFLLEPDTDGGTYDKWIPSGTGDANNPFNDGSIQSAVWSTGMRNNQGFAYAKINGVDRLYGASHGPFSDDELNLIERGKNYGHPIVVGYNDGNYNNARAGQKRYPYSGGTDSNLPFITDENANVNAINAAIPDSYRDPLYCFYDTISGNTGIVNSIQYIYNNTSDAYNQNASWASEGLSGLGIYPYSNIPGWKNSLLYACLKRGRILRTKLNAEGTAMIPIDGKDTVSYFNSKNKFRDVAVAANGRDIYAVIDKSATTSGPGATNPIVSTCGGCVQKYTFVGYSDNSGASTIPTSIPVARGISSGGCVTANSITINTTNRNYWVPITDDSSNIIAEIKANNNSLGVVNASFFYKNTGAVREDGSANRRMYMDRNITITPTVQPTSNVNIRLYITAAELARISGKQNSLGQPSGINSINDVSIFKANSSTCETSITSGGITKLTTTRASFGDGYVLSATINSFSTFFLASNSLTTLPVNLISFRGDLKPNKSVGLEWKASEVNTAKYEVERSLDGQNYVTIGTVAATGNSGTNAYSYIDNDASLQPTIVLYYRLKMVDIDESYTYSNIVTVSLADIAGKVIVTPNPAAGFTRLTITSAGNGNVQWSIVDNAGRIVLQSNMQLRSGANTSTINISKLAAGMYYLNVTGSGINEKVKLQKL